MQRKWAVPPDQGEVMSREALISALVDGATILDIAGGCLEVVVGRVPTQVAGEMVMNGAILCWRDRTDAKPQAEVAHTVVPETGTATEAVLMQAQREREAAASVALDGDTQFDPQAEAEAREEANDVPANIDPDDGFDYSTLAEEDVDEPVTAR